jgi:enoyl-CoA hydratase/carnithine racemase
MARAASLGPSDWERNMTDNLVVRTDMDGLATLTLNRPDKLNALNTELFRELGAHVDAIAADVGRVGCVVVRGSGRAFSAGHDRGAIGDGESHEEHNLQAGVIERLANLPQPVISAVHGPCFTGALELALAGDVILAARSARFADTHGKWGLTPIWGMSQRLPRRVGLPKAREMMFTCRTLDGTEACAIGLANACFEDERFEAEVEDFARSILANSWFSSRANKRLLIESDGVPLAQGLAQEVYRNEGRAPDSLERIAAFARRAK